jgi:hypothetical protein
VNEFFVPWRSTSLDQVPDEEMRALYVEGYWTRHMDASRPLNMAEVRDARGSTLSKKQREEIAHHFKVAGPWCIET